MYATKRKIAVIEDEEDILEAIAYTLTREGYQVCSAVNGQDGLKLVREERPDLVLLDLMLPELDGKAVCRRIRSDRNTRSPPLIMVTARTQQSDILKGLSLGADDYILKPFSMKVLVARVKAVLRRGGEARPDGLLEQSDETKTGATVSPWPQFSPSLSSLDFTSS